MISHKKKNIKIKSYYIFRTQSQEFYLCETTDRSIEDKRTLKKQAITLRLHSPENSSPPSFEKFIKLTVPVGDCLERPGPRLRCH